RYRIAGGADAIEGASGNQDGSLAFRGHPLTVQANDFDAVMEVKPEKGATVIKRDLVLDPGRTVAVQVRGPDGKPRGGVRVFGQFPRGGWEYEALPAEFTAYGLGPKESRTLLLQDAEKKLVGRCEIKADERGPVVVTLEPAATLTGRLLDEKGRPLKQAT